MDAKNVLIMAAGTGGHVFPALACAKEFQDRGYAVHWLGTPKGMENELVSQAGFPLHSINVTGIRGKNIKTLLKAPFLLLGALMHARKLLKELNPVCVVGFGGFVTGPGGLAAKLAGIPLIIHEQNAKVGTANRYLSKIATKVCQAFPNAFDAKVHPVTTGNPVRKELFTVFERTAIDGRKVHLLIIGGSLGAEALNKLLPDALALLDEAERPEVFHQSGKNHADITVERYQKAAVSAKVEPFVSDMLQAYQWADLVVCRAGALTVSELAATGSAAILIPLPTAIDDHQSFNADYLASHEAAIKLVQAELTPQVMANHLRNLFKDSKKLVDMGNIAKKLAQPNATTTVVNICLEATNG